MPGKYWGLLRKIGGYWGLLGVIGGLLRKLIGGYCAVSGAGGSGSSDEYEIRRSDRLNDFISPDKSLEK